MKTKIMQMEIRDNTNLPLEELNDRVKVLALAAIKLLSKEEVPKDNCCYTEKIAKVFSELLDVYRLIEKQERK